ncbi:MAG: hypothetical protein HYY76_18795 [Acidobacteria bacterium]|nr:hypothetical protein [Acidobacteriota bacterium]
MTDPFAPLARALAERGVRYVLIGVSGANFYAVPPASRFVTDDYALFLPPDPDNLVRAWGACEEVGGELWLTDEPLDRPRARWLAERIIERRAVTRVTGAHDLKVDLTLVMKGFEFEAVWRQRRLFLVESIEVPTARLLHIVASKQAAGRLKDQLFLATHQDALEQLLKKPKLD